MVLEKLFEVVSISYLKQQEFQQNHICRKEVDHCDKTPQQILVILTILNTDVPLMFHDNLKPNILSGFLEEVDFFIFAIFSNGGNQGYST